MLPPLVACVLPSLLVGQGCPIATHTECEKPKHYAEVSATSPAGCCDMCSNNTSGRCVYWSFKATDVAKGIVCRLFDGEPEINRSSSEFVSGAAAPSAPPGPPSAVRLRINGSSLLQPDGNPLVLRGFNWPLEHVHPGDGALMRVHLPGTTVARIVGVLWDNSAAASDCFSENPPYFQERCFGPLDAAVKAATAAKVWVILAARCKYAAGQNYDTDPMADVFHNATLRGMLYTAWRHIATHYASWDYIAAYEIMSEPRDKLATPSVVRDFYDGGCAAVQSVDPLTPCMVGPGPYYKLWKFTPDILLQNPNVIYTFDYFVPEAWTFGQPEVSRYPGTYNCSTLYTDVWAPTCCPRGGGVNLSFDAEWTVGNLKQWAAPVQQSRLHGGVPIFVNQWSVVHGVPASAGRYTYMADVARELQAMGVGWAWWVWRGGGDGWAHGSSEFVYEWTNGTLEYDLGAFEAVRPYM